jgi:antitoxin ParD1/3/4
MTWPRWSERRSPPARTASESEVIRDGLRALLARDAAVEHWLRECVAPVFDRVARGEEKLHDATEVFSGLEARYRARKSQ